jgi:outer membrane protein insertion porin family
MIFSLFLTFLLSNQIIIGIEAQTQSTDSILIISQSGLKVGDELTQQELSNALHRIHNLGLYSEVEVDTFLISDGVKIKFILNEFPRLKKIDFSGNRKLRTKELKELVNAKEGEILTEKKVFDWLHKIKTRYKEKGFILAKINYVQSPPDSIHQSSVVYQIEEGDQVRIRQIEIVGNDAFSDKTIEIRLTNREKTWYRKANFKEDEFKKDLDKIIDFYKERGYLDAKVIDYNLSYDQGWIYITIEVNESKKYHFGNITFEGESLLTEDRLKRSLRIKSNEIYNTKKATQTLSELYAIYSEEGYIYVMISPLEEIREDTVDITYKIIEGNPAKIRLVTIGGNERTNENVIRREISSLPGSIFKRSEVIRSQRDIFNLGFFEDVGLDYKTVNESGEIDLTYRVKEKTSFGTIGAGISYSAVDKLTGYIELSQPNMFGRGQRVYIKLEKGGRKTNAEFGFSEPYLFDIPLSAGFDLSYLTRVYDYYDKQEIGAGINFSRSLPLDFSRGYLSFRISDAYVPKNSIVSGYSPTGLYNVYRDTIHRTSFLPSFRFLRDSRDYIYNALSGSSVSYTIGLSVGDIRFHRHIIDASFYYPVFWKFGLMFRSRFGIINPFQSKDTIPIYERFYAGGTGEDGIRGYPDRSIGTKEGSYTIGGRSLSIFSLEYKLRLSYQVSFITFFDAGNAWESFSKFNISDLKRGAGIGVRLEIPMLGLLGFDLGYGFDYEKIENGKPVRYGQWQPHFQIGRTF